MIHLRARSLLALTLAALLAPFVVPGPSPVAALSACARKNHTVSLTSGKATPAVGSTTTRFTFSVTYRDTSGCPASSVTLGIAGGTYAMSAGSGDPKTGVTYTRRLVLPAGAYAYRFDARSESGHGNLNAGGQRAERWRPPKLPTGGHENCTPGLERRQIGR